MDGNNNEQERRNIPILWRSPAVQRNFMDIGERSKMVSRRDVEEHAKYIGSCSFDVDMDKPMRCPQNV